MALYSSVIGRSEMPFQIFIGGRGIGKTYSALSSTLESDSKYMFMRRTAAEIEAVCNNLANPFKVINRDFKRNIGVEYIPKQGYGYFGNTDIRDEKEVLVDVLGYAAPLSTFSKIRGVDFSDVEYVIFDEFIPEKHVHKINAEGDAFLHFYESVNRNREFEGRPPLRVYLLANAINLNNQILLALGVVSIIAEMKIHGRHRYTDKERGVYIELMENAEFKERKGETALYRLTGGTSFSEQALNNEFTDDSFVSIDRNVKLIEYKPMFRFGSYTVYTHKSNGDMYICKKKAAGVIQYEECDKDIMYWRFAPTYRMMVLQRRITYDDYATKLVFDALTKRS